MPNVEEMVDQLFGLDSINDCCVITMSGNPVVIRSSNGLDSDVFSALCATIFGAAASLDPQDFGEPVEVSIRNRKNDITIKKCGRKTLLAVVRNKSNGCQTCNVQPIAIRNTDANEPQV